jgi:hypothetical protein
VTLSVSPEPLESGARQIHPDYARLLGIAPYLPGGVLGVLRTGDDASQKAPLLRTPFLQEPAVVGPRYGRGILRQGEQRQLQEVVWEKYSDVHVNLVELFAHLLWGVHHAGALVARGELGFMNRGSRREAGYVEVEFRDVRDVLQGLSPGHVAVGDQLLGRFVDMHVTVYDQDVF